LENIPEGEMSLARINSNNRLLELWWTKRKKKDWVSQEKL
jgi:hypothetical protein